MSRCLSSAYRCLSAEPYLTSSTGQYEVYLSVGSVAFRQNDLSSYQSHWTNSNRE
jgi:hypothetical protein